MSSQHQASRTTAAVQTGHPQRSARQPLSVKNSMPNSAIKNNSSSKGEVAGEEAYPIKPIPDSHLAPPARFRRPAAATTISSPPLINTSSTTAPSPNQRIYTSHHPSPLGLKVEELPGSDGGSSSSSSQMAPAPLSPSIIKTPKKRAIPVEDVHVRNTVPGHQVDELDGPSQSPNPNKRSRSSKHGSSATDPSTSTSLSIATELGDVNLQSQGAASYVPMHHHQDLPPPLPKHHAVQPSHTHAQNHPSRPLVPPPHPRQTTTRIDKQSRMTENDRLQRERQKIEAQKEWRKKFLKAFPLFHFHLDGFDEALRKEITGIIEQLGGVSTKESEKMNYTR